MCTRAWHLGEQYWTRNAKGRLDRTSLGQRARSDRLIIPGKRPSRDSNPNVKIRGIAQFPHNTAPRRVLTRWRDFGDLPESRGITQFRCPNLSEKFSLLFRRERGDDFHKPRIAAKRRPGRIELELPVIWTARNFGQIC